MAFEVNRVNVTLWPNARLAAAGSLSATPWLTARTVAIGTPRINSCNGPQAATIDSQMPNVPCPNVSST